MRLFIDDESMYQAPVCDGAMRKLVGKDLGRVIPFEDEMRLTDLYNARNTVFQRPGYVFDAANVYRREDTTLWLLAAGTSVFETLGLAYVVTNMKYNETKQSIVINTVAIPLSLLHTMERRKIIDDLLKTI